MFYKCVTINIVVHVHVCKQSIARQRNIEEGWCTEVCEFVLKKKEKKKSTYYLLLIIV